MSVNLSETSVLDDYTIKRIKAASKEQLQDWLDVYRNKAQSKVVWAVEAELDRKSQPAGISDGSSADYYKLPPDSTQLQDLISYRDMNAQMGEIFRATYRYGQASHSDKLRDAKKIKFYIEAEIARLEKLND